MTVSIVIPVYNGATFVREAIDSALSQSWPHCEVIVVNDGSTDGTADILASYGRAIVVVDKPNGGTSSAMNAGIRRSKGKYVAWLSHDDAFLPLKSEKQVKFLENHPEYVACYTDYDVMNGHGAFLSHYVSGTCQNSLEALRRMFCANFISGCSMMIRRTVFDTIGLFREDLRYTTDFEMWLRILEEYAVGYIPETLEKQRVHKQQQGNWNKVEYRRETVQVLIEKHDILMQKGIFDNGRAREQLWLGDILANCRNYFPEAKRIYWKAAMSGNGFFAAISAVKICGVIAKEVRLMGGRWARAILRRNRTSG